jgi:hypothetical protein
MTPASAARIASNAIISAAATANLLQIVLPHPE